MGVMVGGGSASSDWYFVIRNVKLVPNVSWKRAWTSAETSSEAGSVREVVRRVVGEGRDTRTRTSVGTRHEEEAEAAVSVRSEYVGTRRRE